MMLLLRNTFLFLLASAFLACNNKAGTEESGEDTVNNAENYYWDAGLNDSTGKLQLIKVPTTDTLAVVTVINYMNKEHQNIKLEYLRTSQDTIFLRIADATYLTQQMGSSGPPIYLSKVVWNFTELPGIHEVSIDFEEGDHASPGTFNRQSFAGE